MFANYLVMNEAQDNKFGEIRLIRKRMRPKPPPFKPSKYIWDQGACALWAAIYTIGAMNLHRYILSCFIRQNLEPTPFFILLLFPIYGVRKEINSYINVYDYTSPYQSSFPSLYLHITN